MPSTSASQPVVFRPRTPEELRACFVRLRQAGQDLARLSLPELLAPLEKLGAFWQPGTVSFAEARSCLAGLFSSRAVEGALQGLALALKTEVLTAELHRELGRADLLDAWAPDEMKVGHMRGYPLGVVAQVLAGNVFLGGVIALAQSLLTRNAVLLKLSREDSGFTELFTRSLRQADSGGLLARAITVAAWNSEQEEFNQVLREEADAVVVWGGQAAIDAYPADRCRGRVLHYGPRLGIGFVLDGVELDKALPALAWDVALWEQRACSSPRLLFAEDVRGNGTLPSQVAAGLSRALAAVRQQLLPRPLTLDEKSEVLSLRELAYWSDRAQVFASPQSMDHTVLLTSELPREVAIGYRTVMVVPLAKVSDLPEMLAPYRTGLQTAILAAPAARWPETVDVLVRAGITQVAAAGSAASRFLGLPHEGEFALRRLVRLVGIDLGAGPLVYPGRNQAELLSVAEVLGDANERKL
jgi:phenylacetate-CoA ligase